MFLLGQIAVSTSPTLNLTQQTVPMCVLLQRQRAARATTATTTTRAHLNLQFMADGQGRVLQRLDDRRVRVGELGVLPNQRDRAVLQQPVRPAKTSVRSASPV